MRHENTRHPVENSQPPLISFNDPVRPAMISRFVIEQEDKDVSLSKGWRRGRDRIDGWRIPGILMQVNRS